MFKNIFYFRTMLWSKDFVAAIVENVRPIDLRDWFWRWTSDKGGKKLILIKLLIYLKKIKINPKINKKYYKNKNIK
jgi:hypothetical protein